MSKSELDILLLKIFGSICLAGLTFSTALNFFYIQRLESKPDAPQSRVDGIPPAVDTSAVAVAPPLPSPALFFIETLLATLDEAWLRESSCGTDPAWRITGPAGEEGEYQIRPIFKKDVKRLSGYEIDVYDNDSCRYGIFIYLEEYAPRVGAVTVEDMYQLFRRGPSGYRTWKGM